VSRQLAPTLDLYGRVLAQPPRDRYAAMRELGREDLFFLLVVLCRRKDIARQWLLDRCDEVRAKPDGMLDLWAREHGKSSIITFGLTIQTVLRDPEVTIGIFSHTRPLAKGFLVQIKRELEDNDQLKQLYPDIFWQEPAKQSSKWSDDGGLIVKRKGNPKESTIEAYGIVDGQPIGKHYRVMVFDDIVTRDNAVSPEMRRKTIEALSLAQALGTDGGVKRYVGTRYHYSDPYAELIKQGSAKPRVYPAEVGGKPVLLSPERMAELRRDMIAYVFSAQMMLDPKGDESVGFKPEWRRLYEGEVDGNTYAVVDPANAQKKDSDYTAIWVVTAGEDGNWYVRDMVYKRMALEERVKTYIDIHRKWRPLQMGIEQYGMMADAEALRIEQRRIGYRFDVVELGGKIKKNDRIARLEPLYRQGKIYEPAKISRDMGPEGTIDVLGKWRREEYDAWPYAGHDDGLDALSRICDLRVVWPSAVGSRPRQRDAIVSDPLAA
jgi:predicted phage terminase large subunit-like protein